MYTIIVGCGRVGAELAQLLSSEGHDVVIIDRNEDVLSNLGKAFNGITIAGNGFDIDLLKRAGIEKCDAFCAITDNDNTNLVAAQVAREMFKVKKAIARIYDHTRAHIYHSLGLNIISGTMLFAARIRDQIIESRLSTYLIESKDIGVLEIAVTPTLKGKAIKDINVSGDLLIAAVKKMTKAIIPDNNYKVEDGDVLMAIVKTRALEKIKKRFRL
ncbi:MAG: potassium channel family protein [Candidatus Omnitrophota bacterium]